MFISPDVKQEVYDVVLGLILHGEKVSVCLLKMVQNYDNTIKIVKGRFMHSFIKMIVFDKLLSI